jgi:uncharacterized protein (TIGR02300 family)
MSTIDARRKALRGTKRTCQSCEVRFYDHAHNPNVCPACGAHFTPPTEPAVQAKARAPFGKTGWRSQPPRRVSPTLPDAEAMPSDRLDAEAVDEEIEEAATVESEDDTVLEPQHDDTEGSGLVNHADGSGYRKARTDQRPE